MTTPDDERRAREAAESVVREMGRVMEQTLQRLARDDSAMGRGPAIEPPVREVGAREAGYGPEGAPVPSRDVTDAQKLAAERERAREYDSQDRREAIQRNLERAGVNTDLRAIRQLFELGQGTPPDQIASRHAREEQAAERARDERERDARGRDERGRER